jgi:hypothetical protein
VEILGGVQSPTQGLATSFREDDRGGATEVGEPFTVFWMLLKVACNDIEYFQDILTVEVS